MVALRKLNGSFVRLSLASPKRRVRTAKGRTHGPYASAAAAIKALDAPTNPHVKNKPGRRDSASPKEPMYRKVSFAHVPQTPDTAVIAARDAAAEPW